MSQVVGVVVRSYNHSSGFCLVGATNHVISRSDLVVVSGHLVLLVGLSGNGSCHGTAVIKSRHFGGTAVQVARGDIMDAVNPQACPYCLTVNDESAYQCGKCRRPRDCVPFGVQVPLLSEGGD